MKYLVILAFLSLSFCGMAQNTEVSTQDLLKETQLTVNENHRLRLVWWVPTQFWQASFDKSPGLTKEQADEFISALDKYTIFIVLNANTSGIGFNFTDSKAIKDSVALKALDGKTYKPINDSLVDESTALILEIMKPVFSNLMGKMGENLTFVLFEKSNKKNEELASPLKTGSITLTLGDKGFTFRLPLGSLMPQKKCPVDGEKMNGGWLYCPHHGKKLEEIK